MGRARCRLDVGRTEVEPVSIVDGEYVSLEAQADYRWPNFETEEALAARIKRTLEALSERYKGETILTCTHGGPSGHAYKQLLGEKAKEGLLAGYTALYIFVRGEDGTFDARIAADQSHLQGGAEMGLPHLPSTEPLSGPNDSKEQV